MWKWLQRVRCRCMGCGETWRIPVGRLHGMERVLGLAAGESLLWARHDCHDVVVIPDPYVDHHGDRVQIDPGQLDSTPPVYRF